MLNVAKLDLGHIIGRESHIIYQSRARYLGHISHITESKRVK